MGHLYHGYVINNQRVNDGFILSRGRWFLRRRHALHSPAREKPLFTDLAYRSKDPVLLVAVAVKKHAQIE